MSQFLAFAALTACLVPALVAVAFASRKPTFLIWNFGWFWIMGWLGQEMTLSPYGRLIGLLFAFVYVSRLLSGPSSRIQAFDLNDFINKQNQFRRAPRPPGKPHPSESPDIIEAEFYRKDTLPSTPNKTPVIIENL